MERSKCTDRYEAILGYIKGGGGSKVQCVYYARLLCEYAPPRHRLTPTLSHLCHRLSPEEILINRKQGWPQEMETIGLGDQELGKG